MKNFIRLSLLLSVFCIFLCACSGSAEKEVFDDDFLGTESGIDLGGTEFVYQVNLDSGNGVTPIDNYLGYVYNTELCDLAIKRVQDVEKQFNCTVRVTNDGTAADFQLQAASGRTECDIYLGPSFNSFAWAKAGLLAGISTLSEYIDYKDTEKWGNPLFLECMSYQDELYGLTPNAWPELNYSSIGYPLFANIDLIRQNGANDPRELVEQKEWTWEAFHPELRANTVTEGQEVKSYGLVSHDAYFSEMIFASNGVHYASVASDGSYYCGFYRDAAFRAAEEIQKVWYGEYADTVNKGVATLSEVTMRSFVDGSGAYSFLPTHFLFGVFGEISMKLNNFAILPTPTGPDVDPGYVAAIYHAMYYDISFPICTDQLEEAAMVVNAIYEPLPGFETQEAVKDYMSHNYFFDDRDADVFFDLYNHAYYNYFYPTSGKSREIPANVVRSNKTMTEVLEASRSVNDDLFNEYIVPALDGITSLFPDFVS